MIAESELDHSRRGGRRRISWEWPYACDPGERSVPQSEKVDERFVYSLTNSCPFCIKISDMLVCDLPIESITSHGLACVDILFFSLATSFS